MEEIYGKVNGQQHMVSEFCKVQWLLVLVRYILGWLCFNNTSVSLAERTLDKLVITSLFLEPKVTPHFTL